MNIKMIYKGKDFWGMTTQREDEMYRANMKHLFKCFRRLKVDREAAIHISDYSKNKEKTISVFWTSYCDYEDQYLTIREYERWNSYETTKMAFEKAKKYIVDTIAEERKEM